MTALPFDFRALAIADLLAQSQATMAPHGQARTTLYSSRIACSVYSGILQLRPEHGTRDFILHGPNDLMGEDATRWQDEYRRS
jgi:hypothetical protein